MTPILDLKLFDVIGIDFMGLFVSSYYTKYLLVVVDYVSKRLEVVALPNNEGCFVTTFLKKNIFSRFSTLRAIVNNCGLIILTIFLRAYLKNVQ